MNTQLKCGACGSEIPDKGVVFAIRIKQVEHAICETCKNKIPIAGRIPQEGKGMSGRSSLNPNIVEIHIAMRNQEKKSGLELGEVRLRVRTSVAKEKWPKISFNGHEA